MRFSSVVSRSKSALPAKPKRRVMFTWSMTSRASSRDSFAVTPMPTIVRRACERELAWIARRVWNVTFD